MAKSKLSNKKNIKKNKEDTETEDIDDDIDNSEDLDDSSNSESDTENDSETDDDNNDDEISDKEDDNKEKDDINESETEILIDEENNEVEKLDNKIIWHEVPKEERISDNFLSDFEYVNCLAIRTKQITLDAKILLKNADELKKKYTPKEIAKLEIKNKCCPLIIVRKIPNGNIEKWSINELDILFDLD